jgi:hypothetical protein
MGTKEKTINIPPLEMTKMRIRIEGISPLICHHFSEKARGIIRDKVQNKKTKPREAKNPKELFNAARYRVDENGVFTNDNTGADAIPARYVKEAVVDAARLIDGISMAEMRQLIFIELGRDGIPIKNGKGTFGIDIEPELEESVQRVGGKGKATGQPDLRYRPLYRDWAAEFEVKFNRALVGEEEILNLLNTAGFHCGLCEHRPSKSGGQNGMFEVTKVLP